MIRALLATLLLAFSAAGAGVEGYVYAPDGTPVSNATVTASVPAGSPLASVKTEDGRFALTELPDSIIEVDVRAEGFAPAVVRVLAGDAPLSVALQPVTPDGQIRRAEARRSTGDATLSGLVKLGDKPLAGVPLILESNAEQVVRVVTDAKGRYRATGLLPVRTFVAPEGLEPRIRGQRELSSVDLAKNPDGTLDLVLTKAPMISGRVVDADGKPVARAQVLVVLAGRSTFDFMQEIAARTTPDGRYAVPAPAFEPAETVNVAVNAPRTSTVRSKAFILGEGNHTVDVTLPRMHAVTLRVLARDGKPVPDALVAFAESEEIAGFRDARALLMQPFASRAIRADADGKVQLQLVPGMYAFAAEAEHFLTGMLERNVVRAATIDLTLEQSFAIRGRVHRNGTGVAGVIIRVLGNEGMGRELSATTGADGRYELKGLPPGKYRLGVYKHEELVQRTIEAEAPGTTDVALPAAGVLRGRVVDAATREGVREFVYSIEPVAPSEENERYGRPMMQRAEADGDGTFTATLAAGTYRVSAGANGYTLSTPVEVRLTEREPADVEIALERGATITGRVTDESGMPLPGADVFVAGAELERIRSRSAPRVGPGNTRTADDGTYTVAGIEPGTASMTVRKEGYVPFRKAVEVDAVTTVDVQLDRGLTIEGVVLRNGKPVPDVSVGATSAALGGDHQPAITDENGRFVLRGLIAARYTVTAYRDDVNAEVRDVDPTKQKEVVISLDPRPEGVLFGSVTGIPTNLGGKIVRRVVFVQSNDRGVEGLIDEAGNYRIENAPTGTVSVVAQLESTMGGRSSPKREVEVLAGEPVRVDLDLGSGTNVSGRVTHEGSGVQGVRVVFASQNGIGASATTRADGTYDAALPGPGTYQIFAHGEAVVARHFQSVREIRGGETIDIDLREQSIDGTVVDADTRQPIAGAIVTLAADVAGIDSVAAEVPTDANGRFRLLTAASGPHRVVVTAFGYGHAEQKVNLGGRDAQSFAFELRRAGELRVRVSDAKTGIALDAYVVVATDEGVRVPARGERSPDGEWFVFSLAPGKYRLTSVVAGYEQKEVEVTAPGVVEVGM